MEEEIYPHNYYIGSYKRCLIRQKIQTERFVLLFLTLNIFSRLTLHSRTRLKPCTMDWFALSILLVYSLLQQNCFSTQSNLVPTLQKHLKSRIKVNVHGMIFHRNTFVIFVDHLTDHNYKSCKNWPPDVVYILKSSLQNHLI